ncbi:CesD/SycD/LcrH family type III secretion system chaperone [Deltaproteobacteria bacterium Smac51]|nr:CesD/SycD/LcrH family type III secretion system chaperone [Deltaproteobacteria bacterium Smac51]
MCRISWASIIPIFPGPTAPFRKAIRFSEVWPPASERAALMTDLNNTGAAPKEMTQEDFLADVMYTLKTGLPPAVMAGISPEQLEALYGLGYQLYTSGGYEDAETVFQALCLYDYNQARFWMGLAGTQQALGKYLIAVDSYSMAALAEGLNDPEPVYYGGLCCLKADELERAKGALEAIPFLEGAAAKPEIVEKAKNLLEIIRLREESE